jgi:hypothetical protein
MHRLVFSVCVVGCAAWLSSCDTRPRIADPDNPVVRTATAAVERFHAGIAAGQYDKTCLDIDLHALPTQLPCRDFLAWLHSRMGKVMETRRTQLPLIGVGRDTASRVSLEYVTRFESAEAHERFEWRVSEGVATATSYRIDAPDLAK